MDVRRPLGLSGRECFAEQTGLLPTGIGNAAADAYRTLRSVQHKARLDEASLEVDPASLKAERQAIRALWAAVFADGSL